MAKKKDSRKWVVRAIIAFVVILGLLTFFSNTIMNATIPKVIGAYASRGNLSYSNNATGVVDIANKTEVIGIEGREIASVEVNEFEYVNEGDVLFILKEGDQEALEGLRDELEELERAEEYANRQPVEPNDYTSYREAITMAEESLREAQETLAAAQNVNGTVAAANQVISSNQATLISLNAEIASASDTLESIYAQISAIDSQLETINGNIDVLVLLGTPTPTPVVLNPEEPAAPVEGEESAEGETPAEPTPAPDRTQMDALCAQRDELMTSRSELESQLGAAQSRLDNASGRLAEVNGLVEEAQETLAMCENLPSVTMAQSAVNTANSNLAAARRALTTAQINDGIAADQTQDAIDARHEQMDDLREQIEEMEAQFGATEILAPASGSVYGIVVGKDDPMMKDQVICYIIPDENERDAYVDFTFPTNVAQNLYQGMNLTTDAYWVRSVTVDNIRPDPSNPRDSRIVRCSVTASYGGLYPGESITVVADRANSNYDHVISSSAINEDNNGTFVYVIEESTGPLGDKYVVRRVNVTVEATDGSKSAISGEGLDNVQIVTRSEEPLHDGDRVRLEDYSK